MDKKQELELIAAVVAVGQEFKPLHKKLIAIFTPEVRQQIETLKTEVFGIGQGDGGRLVNVSTDPHKPLNFYWGEFVDWCFGVSPRRINQLLETDEAREERLAAKRAEEERLLTEQEVERQRQIADVTADMTMPPAGCSEAEAKKSLRDAWEKLKAAGGGTPKDKRIGGILDLMEITPLGDEDEDDEPLDTTVTPKAPSRKGVPKQTVEIIRSQLESGVESRIDEAYAQGLEEGAKDPYAYFEQFVSPDYEPQTLGDEISSMLIELKLDMQQIKEVLRYAEMSAKRTLNQLQTAVAA